MYLLDANVLIFAKRDYYPLDRVPEYWEWLLHQAEQEVLKLPYEIWRELQEHDDDLQRWVRDHQDILVLKEDGLDIHVPNVLACYGANITEAGLEQIGADPFLIAAAKSLSAIVVSKEVSAPAKQGVNRRVPDICASMGVRCITDHVMIRELDFRTNWKARA